MHGFTENQLIGAFLAIAVLLLAARGMAEVCRRIGQPEVLGELLGGFLVGPSVFGGLFPVTYKMLFLNPAVSLALSLLAWIGAILLLMIAGLEADLAILRQKIAPGLLAAGGAIGSSIALGTYLGTRVYGYDITTGFFLGLVLSVTAVSVVAKLLIEREALRRDYAQVLLAAGIAGEVLVWPLISVVSAIHQHGNPTAAGLRATALAIVFFIAMLTLGRSFTFWAMRKVADLTGIPNGELSLVLILLCLSAACTAAMGLHPLLGAFVFGLLLSKAPRATVVLKERVQGLTVGLFAPIFFGLAGMQVNLFELRGVQSIKSILILLVVAGAAKLIAGSLGALVGKLPFWEAGTVGVGLNLKGGTDVVVAIIGTELRLFPLDLYTVYAVVAILTVVISPPVMNWMAAKTKPGEDELKRLNREEARKLAYLADRERVLLPLVPELIPAASAVIVAAIAAAKHTENELFDMTELSFKQDASLTRAGTPDSVVYAASHLAHAAEHEHVQLERISSASDDKIAAMQVAAEGQHLIVVGTSCVSGETTISLGDMQDAIVRDTMTDVLVTVSASGELQNICRILVLVNAMSYSLAAADIAAYVAKGCGATVVLMTVMSPRLDTLFWKDRRHRDLLQAGYQITRDAAMRVTRLDVEVSERVVVAADAAQAAFEELDREPYDLIVLGGILRSSETGLALGRTLERLLLSMKRPTVLLLSRQPEVVST
jgi:Kef-type K+ transport system membrane component KefB/nucleotide-binding universal stress UspA family protein